MEGTVDITTLRAWCAADFRNYLAYAMDRDHYTTDPVHNLMANYLQGAKSRWVARKKTILGFRGYGKTYTCVRRYIEWRILRVPQTQVIVQSSTDKLAGAITQALMETCRYDPVFEGLRPKSGTGTMAFTLQGVKPEKGEQVTCAGIKTSLTGSRANLYIFDDPEPDVQPEALYERILAAFIEAEFILHPAGHLWQTGDVPVPERTQFVVVGQPHWTGTAYIPRPADTLTGEADPHPLSDSLFLRIPALRRVPVDTPGAVLDHPDDPTPKGGVEYAEISMMPSRFDTAELIRKRNQRIITPATWRLQMDIDITPVEGLGAVIKVSRLPIIRRDPGDAHLRIMIVDPADSEDGCEWGIASLGLFGNMIHVFDLLGFRATIWDDQTEQMPGEAAWESIFDWLEDLDHQRLYIEKNYKGAITAAKRVLRRRSLKATVYEYAATVQKLTRIVRGLDHPLNGGLVSFEPHVLDDGATFREMAELRHTRLPRPNDRLDALAAGVQVLLESPAVGSPTRNAVAIQVPRPGGPDPRPATFREVATAGETPFSEMHRTSG